MIISTAEVIGALCKNHGIEDEGYSVEEAKDLCGVAEIIKHKGIPVKEEVCVDWFDGDCGNKRCENHLHGECEYGGNIIVAVGGMG